jgi:hypothetical protein
MCAAQGGGGLQALTCERCGAAVQFMNERFVVCSYCGQVYNLSDVKVPARGELLLGADFRDPNVPGWRLYHKESLRVGEGRLAGDFRKQQDTRWIIESFGSFDNVDASVTITFLEVEDATKHCRLGFALRWTEEGRYSVDIAPKGNYCVASYEKKDGESKWHILVDFASHPSLRAGVGVPNRLRVVMLNDHIRVYINGALASSVRDPKFTYGTVGIVLENSGSDAEFALSDLELREPVENV